MLYFATDKIRVEIERKFQQKLMNYLASSIFSKFVLILNIWRKLAQHTSVSLQNDGTPKIDKETKVATQSMSLNKELRKWNFLRLENHVFSS